MERKEPDLIMRQANPLLQPPRHHQDIPQRVDLEPIERLVDRGLQQRFQLVHAVFDLRARERVVGRVRVGREVPRGGGRETEGGGRGGEEPGFDGLQGAVDDGVYGVDYVVDEGLGRGGVLGRRGIGSGGGGTYEGGVAEVFG